MFGLNFDFVSIYVRVGNKNNKLRRYSRSHKGDSRGTNVPISVKKTKFQCVRSAYHISYKTT